jgi:hypothetical protein
MPRAQNKERLQTTLGEKWQVTHQSEPITVRANHSALLKPGQIAREFKTTLLSKLPSTIGV